MGSSSASGTLSPADRWPDAESGSGAPARADASPAAARAPAAGPTAADRFRRHAGDILAIAMIVSVIAHFGFFRLFRGIGLPEFDAVATAIAAVELPPEIEIPPPPEAIARPATPTVAAVELSEELTIAPTTFEANPVESLGPPPPQAAADWSERPRFIPYDTPPRLQNGAEIQRLLQSEYPRTLRNAGIGGQVEVWLYVDLSGSVTRAVVKQSSGYALLDAAAERVAARMRFTPARNRDKPTEVWVSQPIGFEVQRGRSDLP